MNQSGWRCIAVAVLVSIAAVQFSLAESSEKDSVCIKEWKTVHRLLPSQRRTVALTDVELAEMEYRQKLYGGGDSRLFPLPVPRPDKFRHKLVEYGTPLECWVVDMTNSSTMKKWMSLEYFNQDHHRFQFAKQSPESLSLEDDRRWALGNKPAGACENRQIALIWNVHNDINLRGVESLDLRESCQATVRVVPMDSQLHGEDMCLKDAGKEKLSEIARVVIFPKDGFDICEFQVRTPDNAGAGPGVKLPIYDLMAHYMRPVQYSEKVMYVKKPAEVCPPAPKACSASGCVQPGCVEHGAALSQGPLSVVGQPAQTHTVMRPAPEIPAPDVNTVAASAGLDASTEAPHPNSSADTTTPRPPLFVRPGLDVSPASESSETSSNDEPPPPSGLRVDM